MPDTGSSTRRQWQFDWRILLFAGVFLPLLVSLGIWQLERAEEKEQQLLQWEQQAESLSWPRQEARGLSNGRPVTLQGRYSDLTWLLDNRTRDGVPGYEVLTVFYPDEGSAVVVNRGWIRAPRTRDRLPRIDVPDEVLEIRGRLAEFPEPPVLADSETLDSGWPRRVQALPRAQAVAQESTLAAKVIRLSDSEQAGAYRADWEPDLMGPQTHYGYAFQWFSLAIALVILTVVASYRKTGANNDNDNG
ncbi:SURF1 family protein [Marinobacter lipolyticus]|uniref:SURF1 family protein n=1 Tax=Marinobacter lipolyticus TaxID=209639 RepID=UPI003A8CF21A